MARHIGSNLPSYPPQHIANCLWALATFEPGSFKDDMLLRTVSAALAGRLTTPETRAGFSSQNVANGELAAPEVCFL